MASFGQKMMGTAALAVLMATPGALSSAQDVQATVLDNDHLGLTLEPTPYEYDAILCTSQARAGSAMIASICDDQQRKLNYAAGGDVAVQQAAMDLAEKSQAMLMVDKLKTLLSTIRPYGDVPLLNLISPDLMKASATDDGVSLSDTDTLESTIFSVMDDEIDFMENDITQPDNFLNEAYRYSAFMSYIFQCNPALGRADVKAAFADVTYTLADIGRPLPAIDPAVCAAPEAKFETAAAVIK